MSFRTGLLGLALALASGCSEREYNILPILPPTGNLTIHGRICDPTTERWLEDALVYTHLYDDAGVVYDSRSDRTAEDGSYALSGLIAGKDYEIIVQVGREIAQSFSVELGDEDLALPDPVCPGSLEDVAVITGAYDDPTSVLGAIGLTGIHLVDGQSGSELVDFLTDPDAMAAFDLVVFDGGLREEGVLYGVGPVDAILDNLRAYVRAGGTVLASDWAYDVVERGWPDEIDFAGDDAAADDAQIGEVGIVEAEVLDAALAAEIGADRVSVDYDLPVWPLVDGSNRAEVVLSGEAPWRRGTRSGVAADTPLALWFADGEGRVALTTYRHSSNGSPGMLAVLRRLIGPDR